MPPDETAVYDFSTELRDRRRVSDKTFAAAVKAFGEQGVMDLIAVMGYYDMVSMALNVDGYPLPDGAVVAVRGTDMVTTAADLGVPRLFNAATHFIDRHVGSGHGSRIAIECGDDRSPTSSFSSTSIASRARCAHARRSAAKSA